MVLQVDKTIFLDPVVDLHRIFQESKGQNFCNSIGVPGKVGQNIS